MGDKEDTSKDSRNESQGNHMSNTSVTSAPKPWEKKEGNILRNKEPARGIFANIDLDSLNRKQQVKEKDPVIEQKVKTVSSEKSVGNLSVANQTVRTVLGIRKEKEEESSEEEFGPKLPPTMIEKSIIISSDSEDDDKTWKEKKKKKEKKRQKEKKKRKGKKEKRNTHYSSSDSCGERRKRKGDSKEEKHKHKKRRRYSSSHD